MNARIFAAVGKETSCFRRNSFMPIAKPCGAYVYAILVDGVVRYIGKGRGRRVNIHLGIAERIAAGVRSAKVQVVHKRMAAAMNAGAICEVRVLSSGLSDEAAYARERAEIAAFPEGHLWNLTDGGEGVSSEGAVRRWANQEYRQKQEAATRSPETIRRRSEASRREQNKPEVRARVKAAQRAAFARPESKAKLVARTKQFWQSDEYRAKVIAGRKAQWTPEARAKQSQAQKTMWTEEYRKARSAFYKARFQDPEFKRALLEKRAATKALRKKAVA